MPESSATFFSARPEIELDGQVQPSLAAGLLGLMVQETVDGLYRCELTLGNIGAVGGRADYLYFDRSLLNFGKKITVKMSVGAQTQPLFTGRIMGLEARYPHDRAPEIAVLAEDRLQDLRMTRRTRVFTDMSDAAIIQSVASAHGLSADVSIAETVQHKVVAQVNQSDLAFLRERCRAIDAELWADESRLMVKSRANRSGEQVRLAYGERLREFTVLADLAHQRTSVRVAGWDPGNKAAILGEAQDSAITSELGSLKSGGSILQQALGGERVEQLVHRVPLTDAEAEAMAKAAFRQAARRFVIGSGVAEGDARIRAGAKVELQELGTMFSGSYYVTEVRQQFDLDRGFQTHFRVERPGI